MVALSGKVAKVKITAVTPTSSTGEATTKLSTGVYQITDVTKRHLDREATGAPIVRVNTTVAASSRYSINPVEGKITFDPSSFTTGAVPVTVDVHYLTASYLGQTRSWSADVETDMNEITAFATTTGSAGWRTIQPGLTGGSVSLGRFLSTATSTADPTFFDRVNLQNSLVIDLHMQNFDRLVGFAYVETDGWANDIESPVEESVMLRLDGPLYYTTSS